MILWQKYKAEPCWLYGRRILDEKCFISEPPIVSVILRNPEINQWLRYREFFLQIFVRFLATIFVRSCCREGFYNFRNFYFNCLTEDDISWEFILIVWQKTIYLGNVRQKNEERQLESRWILQNGWMDGFCLCFGQASICWTN